MNAEALEVSYPVDDGEVPGRVAVDAAHRVRHVLVVVVLLAVAASGGDHPSIHMIHTPNHIRSLII